MNRKGEESSFRFAESRKVHAEGGSTTGIINLRSNPDLNNKEWSGIALTIYVAPLRPDDAVHSNQTMPDHFCPEKNFERKQSHSSISFLALAQKQGWFCDFSMTFVSRDPEGKKYRNQTQT